MWSKRSIPFSQLLPAKPSAWKDLALKTEGSGNCLLSSSSHFPLSENKKTTQAPLLRTTN